MRPVGLQGFGTMVVVQDSSDPSDDAAQDAAAEAIEQFQQAALDAVRAARAMLDAAESIVKDPAALDSVVQTMTTMARSAGETVMGFAAGAGAGARAGREDEEPPDDEPGAGYEPIHVD